MRRKGSVVVMNEGAGWGSGVAVVDGSDRCRREEVAILLASGWISGGGKDGNAAGRRTGSDTGRARPRQRRRDGVGRRQKVQERHVGRRSGRVIDWRSSGQKGGGKARRERAATVGVGRRWTRRYWRRTLRTALEWVGQRHGRPAPFGAIGRNGRRGGWKLASENDASA